MITLSDLLSLGLEVSGTEKFCWSCYGHTAYHLDFKKTKFGEFSAVYNIEDSKVYEATVYNPDTEEAFRWISSEHRQAYFEECEDRGVDDLFIDDIPFLNVDASGEFLNLASKVMKGENYDYNYSVQIDLRGDTLLDLALRAHEEGMTLNDFILKEASEYTEELSEVG